MLQSSALLQRHSCRVLGDSEGTNAHKVILKIYTISDAQVQTGIERGTALVQLQRQDAENHFTITDPVKLTARLPWQGGS